MHSDEINIIYGVTIVLLLITIYTFSIDHSFKYFAGALSVAAIIYSGYAFQESEKSTPPPPKKEESSATKNEEGMIKIE